MNTSFSGMCKTGFVFFLLFIMSCSSIYVSVDRDKGADFSAYSKFKWIKQKNTDDYKSIYKSEINRKRFADAITRTLEKKGYERTDEGDQEFSVVYHLRFDKKLDVTAYGYRYYPATGYAERYVQTRVYQEGSVIIDIIDAKEKRLVWRGAAEGVLQESNNPQEIINETTKAILKDFPRKKKQ